MYSKSEKKKILAHVLGTICVNFDYNWLICLGCRADIDTQTYTQTPSVHPNIFSLTI